jgi:hypothetical protein
MYRASTGLKIKKFCSQEGNIMKTKNMTGITKNL